jgi:pimeloyl-[acyl-carrier protein] methyl ester esterase
MTRLVLLPGMDGKGELFAGFIKALPDTLPAKAIRYPANIFLSYAELLPLVLSACPVNEPFVLLAESYSTPLAIQFAATNPPNLKGLILCAGFASSPRSGLLRILGRLAAPYMFRGPLPKFADRLLLGTNAPASLRASLQTAISFVAPNVLASRLLAVLTCNVCTELGRIEAPILYLQATHDRLVPPRCAEEIREIKPHTEMAFIEASHLLLQREPQQAAEVVTRFIRQHETSD